MRWAELRFFRELQRQCAERGRKELAKMGFDPRLQSDDPFASYRIDDKTAAALTPRLGPDGGYVAEEH